MRYFFRLTVCFLFIFGCSKQHPNTSQVKPYRVVRLCISEYPSYSRFKFADIFGLVDGVEGKYGKLEKKWKVDLVTSSMTYDQCLSMYKNGSIDVICTTNIDALNVSQYRKSVAICPLSKSNGNDALIATYTNKETVLNQLKNRITEGLEDSVSKYVFIRNIELLGGDWEDYQYRDLDPDTALSFMQIGVSDSIMVRNSNVIQTIPLEHQPSILFTSKPISDEIIDIMLVSDSFLQNEKNTVAALLLLDVYYTYGELTKNNQNVYSTPEEGLHLFTNDLFKTKIMNTVFENCEKLGMLDINQNYGFDDKSKDLNFSTYIMSAYLADKVLSNNYSENKFHRGSDEIFSK